MHWADRSLTTLAAAEVAIGRHDLDDETYAVAMVETAVGALCAVLGPVDRHRLVGDLADAVAEPTDWNAWVAGAGLFILCMSCGAGRPAQGS